MQTRDQMKKSWKIVASVATVAAFGASGLAMASPGERANDTPGPIEVEDTRTTGDTFTRTTLGNFEVVPAQPFSDGSLDSPLSVESPASKDSPVSVDSPVSKDSPASVESPVSKDSPVSVDSPVSKDSPASVDSPVSKDSPASPDSPDSPDSLDS